MLDKTKKRKMYSSSDNGQKYRKQPRSAIKCFRGVVVITSALLDLIIGA